MSVGTTLRGLSAMSALLLLTAGCTISVQPWSRPVEIKPPVPVNGPVDPAAPPWFRPPGPTPLPPGGMGQTPFPPNNDAVALLSYKLSSTEDQLNTIQGYVNGLKKEKGRQDEQLVQSTREIEQTLNQIKQLRQDLKQWKGEVEEMNTRIQRLEENRAMMKLLLDRVEAHLAGNTRTTKTAGPKLYE